MLLSKENITFILALIGSIGTVAGGIYSFWCSRVRLEMKIVDFVQHGDIVQLFVEIQNQSSLPICISSISIVEASRKYRCELLQKKIRSSGDLLYRTPLFPLNIPPRTGVLYYFEFLDAPDMLLIPGKSLALSFDTNRRKIERSLVLPQAAHYLRSK